MAEEFLMKASDLHLVELLEMKPERGSIRFKDRRMLLWDADAFGSLRKELIETLSADQARPILKRFGFANGYRDARMTEGLLNWDNDAEWWLSCPALQRHEGKVQPSVQHLLVDREAGSFEMEVEWDHSYEAEQHLRIFGTSETPVCWTLAGFASGFATALMGSECLVVETECVAMGHAKCKVVGKTRQQWGSTADALSEDYQAKPLSDELESRELELRREQQLLAKRERDLNRVTTSSTDIRSHSLRMQKVLTLAETVAKVDSTVLINGESGVGKERIARLVHDESRQSVGPFIAINCGALPETLLDSELFGHVRGSFTGANTDKKGLFEAANDGTIFLDEVGEMSPATQVKLLRVLQEREVWPVGASAPRKINVRVLAATNRDLEKLVADGRFRADLFYRLNVVVIEVPPLRARSEDILPLARTFIAAACERCSLPSKSLTTEAAESLADHPWPGNIRELENAMERAVIISESRSKIERDDLSPNIRGVSGSFTKVRYDQVVPMAEIEKRYTLEVLARNHGNRTRTAKDLGIGANTLWRKLKSWGVPPARGELETAV